MGVAIEGDVDSDEEDVASSGEDNSLGSDMDIAGERVRDRKINECFGMLTRHEDHNRVVGQFCNLVTNLEPPREDPLFLRWARCSAVVSNEGQTRLLRKT